MKSIRYILHCHNSFIARTVSLTAIINIINSAIYIIYKYICAYFTVRFNYSCKASLCFTITKNCRNRNTILHCITFSTNSACIIFTFHIAKTVTVCYCTCTVTGYSSGIVTRLRLYCSITLASIYKSKFL